MGSANRILPTSGTVIGASLLGGSLIPLVTAIRYQAKLSSRAIQYSRILGVGFVPLGLALFASSQIIAYRHSASFQEDLMPFGAGIAYTAMGLGSMLSFFLFRGLMPFTLSGGLFLTGLAGQLTLRSSGFLSNP